ncbi:MAG: glycosyltransferase [Candidatus Omnitrophota bacterium]
MTKHNRENPFKKWFHLDRYRIGNSLVKSKSETHTKILDLNCGACGWNTDRLNVFGVGTNENLLSEARKAHRLYDYKTAEPHRTGLPGESFDIVTIFERPGRAAGYDALVKESFRLLKKGGYCVVSAARGVLPPKKAGKMFRKHGYDIETLFTLRSLITFLIAKKPGPARKGGGDYSDVSIILPTLNEGKNIQRMLTFITANYRNCAILVSDDGSRDKTKDVVSRFGYKNLVFLDRSGAGVHGLVASVLDAIRLVATRYFIVIDADGQHPPAKIEDIVNIMRLGSPLVIASRIAVEDEWSAFRRMLSYSGAVLGKCVLLLRGKEYISYDIMGGFFGCRKSFWNRCVTRKTEKTGFRLKGYKLLFDFLKYAPSRLRIEEIYYRFETRKAETSKINIKICLEFLKSCFLP